MVDSPCSVDGANLMRNQSRHVGIHITLNDLMGTGKYLRTDDYEKLL